MPIYEFHCKECKKEFSALRRINALEGVVCRHCGSGKVARMLSVTARTAPDAGGCASPAPGGGG